jgi:mercuric ion transport protein
MAKEQKKFRNRFIAALVGTGVVALCCSTPALVILFTTVGLAAITPYLDYVLFPALAVFIVLTVISFRKWRKASRRPE